ncbi:MAG: T9SS type A sorting domain-containing protein [Ignavibacterium sp.]|nr:T9SS type A sorting domain-containing protein [Ignavibacterium sp.]
METKIRTRFAVHKSFNPHKLILYRFKILIILITTLLNYKTLAQTPQWEFMGLAGEEIYDIAVDDSGNVYVASWTGIFKSTDDGASWEFKNNGLQIGDVYKLFIDYAGNIYLCGSANFPGYGLYKSTDGGENWVGFADTLNGGPVNYFEDVTIIPNEPGGFIYVSNYYGVYRSTDDGQMWQSTSFTDPGARNIGINTNGYMFFGNNLASWFGIYRSTDLGLNWERHTFLGVSSMVYLRDGSVLTGCYDPGSGSFGIYKTTNNGSNWINTNTISGLDYPSDFVLDTNDDVYVFIGGLNYDGVYLSSNNGNSWANYGLSGYHPVTCLSIDSSGYLWAGAHQEGVYRTEGRTVPVELITFSASVNENDVILNWTTATEINNQGFEIERSEKLEVRNENTDEDWENIGFINGNGTTTEIRHYTFIDHDVNNGCYNYRLKQLDFDGSFEYSNIVEVKVRIPFEFFLSQNYPNPFNPSTIIKYSLKDDGKVSLKIFNSLGEEVRTLVNEIKPAGNYEVEFNASNLPSGVYIYSIQSGDFVSSKKMILLK